MMAGYRKLSQGYLMVCVSVMMLLVMTCKSGQVKMVKRRMNGDDRRMM